MTPRGILFLLSLIVVCGFAPSELVERQEIPVTITDNSTAPIELLDTTGSLLVNRTDSVGRLSGVSPSTMISQVIGWHGRIRYRNRSKQTVTAVEFRWDFFDPFDGLQGVVRVMRQAPLEAGQVDEQKWERPIAFTDAVRATLRVERVRLSDGTTWKAH